MPTHLQKALKATAIAVLAVIAGGIGGFFSHAYLEIWFESVEGLSAINPSTWPNIAKGISAKFDITSPQLYRAYYGENQNLETRIISADFALRDFELTGRIIGSKTKVLKDGPVTYTISGFFNSDETVLTHRGPKGGIGSYWLKPIQDKDNRLFYFGYILTEDQKYNDQPEKWVTQCPFVMMGKELATQSYPTPEDAKASFAVLGERCTEFKLPGSIGFLK